VAELKLDGLSMAARYENGLLQMAITARRVVGEDVTEMPEPCVPALAVKADLPRFEVRGEVIMKPQVVRADQCGT